LKTRLTCSRGIATGAEITTSDTTTAITSGLTAVEPQQVSLRDSAILQDGATSAMQTPARRRLPALGSSRVSGQSAPLRECVEHQNAYDSCPTPAQSELYLDAVTPGKGFSQHLAGAIVSSLLLVVLNTHLLERKQRMGEETWVEREVAFRKAAFLGQSGLLPLRVGGSRIADFLTDISYIDISYIDISPTFEPSFVCKIRSVIGELKEGLLVLPSARVPFVMKSLTE
jgi:hypothetical protein